MQGIFSRGLRGARAGRPARDRRATRALKARSRGALRENAQGAKAGHYSKSWRIHRADHHAGADAGTATRRRLQAAGATRPTREATPEGGYAGGASFGAYSSKAISTCAERACVGISLASAAGSNAAETSR